MKTVLLIGLGRFGRHVARELYELNHQVLAVDENEENVNQVLQYVTGARIGDSTDIEFLKTLGVDNFDACIVTIRNNFQSSLETTSLLKDMGARYVISRASNDIHEKFLLKNGADSVVFPEKQIASWTAIRCTSDHILDYIELDDDHSVLELTIPESWDGKTVAQLDIRKKYGINVVAIRQNGQLIVNINADTVMSVDNPVLVLGSYKKIQKCFKI